MNDINPLAGLKVNTNQPMDKLQAKQTAEEFESLFISQMVEHMFGESMGESAFGSGQSNDVYKGFMAQEYGKQIARSGGIGIASHIEQELLRLQEMPAQPANTTK